MTSYIGNKVREKVQLQLTLLHCLVQFNSLLTLLLSYRQRFRDLTEKYKEEYKRAPQNKLKKKIAKDLLDHIHSFGGRFLRRDESTEHNKAESSSFEGVKWAEASQDTALEKIKQALRENRQKLSSEGSPSKRKNQQEQVNAALNPLGGNLLGSLNPSPVAAPRAIQPQSVPPPPMMLPVLPSTMLASGISAVTIDPRVLILQLAQASLQHQLMLQPPATTPIPSYSPPLIMAMAPGHDPHLYATTNLQSETRIPESYPRRVVQRDLLGHCTAESLVAPQLQVKQPALTESTAGKVAADKATPGPTTAGTTLEPGTEDALDALSALTVANQPKFTEQELEMEQKLTTDEERAEILSDTFGKFCTVNSDSRPDKRARQDLDKESIEFLVSFMRGEIDKVPNEEKKALLEAMKKSDDDEFSDERLECFLRCEGMNARLAAQRFICYWAARREVFGVEKFTLPITLSGALRDDLDALEASTYCVLPQADLSGRPLLYSVPHSRGGKGLSTESLVSAT